MFIFVNWASTDRTPQYINESLKPYNYKLEINTLSPKGLIPYGDGSDWGKIDLSLYGNLSTSVSKGTTGNKEIKAIWERL